jgi:hypothetical protein
MKNDWLVLLALFLLSAPALAVEYQGRNLDGKKLPAKAYSYATGGVYDVQVRFEQQRATIYFNDGNQITINLKQPVITDPENIEGIGKPGYYPLSRNFSIGLDSGNDAQSFESDPLEGFWRISLEESELR